MAGKPTLHKLMILGDGGVGKTALVIQLCLHQFVESYDPTIDDSYRRQIAIDGQAYMLEVLDTAGQKEYTYMQYQWIQNGECFVIVYSISSRASFSSVKKFHHHIQQIKELYQSSQPCPQSPILPVNPHTQIPIMLVGNKSDRAIEREVPTQESHSLARELGCGFVETSAKDCVNVEKAFCDVVRMLRNLKDADEESTNMLQQAANSQSRNLTRFLQKRDGKRCII